MYGDTDFDPIVTRGFSLKLQSFNVQMFINFSFPKNRYIDKNCLDICIKAITIMRIRIGRKCKKKSREKKIHKCS